MLASLKNALAHPLTKGLDLDDPRTTELRIRVIKSKPFLSRIYSDWYRLLRSRLPAVEGSVLEVGSGAGYLGEFVPEAVRSDVFFCRTIDLAADAGSLPFRNATLRAIAMTNVFHHIPEAEMFLEEAIRCLRPGGRIVMIEPWVCGWASWIYRNIHHEPFDPLEPSWRIDAGGPLSSANGALPWIIFVRDRSAFERKFPQLLVEEIRPMMPFRYLVSGGISMRNLAPGVTYNAWRAAEAALSPWSRHIGMFALFCIRRT